MIRSLFLPGWSVLTLLLLWPLADEVTYHVDPWKAGASFWQERTAAEGRPPLVGIPPQLPGPLDAWGGSEENEIIVRTSFDGPAILTLRLTDSHDSAPTTLRIQAGEQLLQTTVAAGTGHQPDRHPSPLTPLTFSFVAARGEPITIRSVAGSWVEPGEIKIAPVMGNWRLPLALVGWFIISLWLLGTTTPPPAHQKEPSPTKRKNVGLGTLLLLAILFLPGGGTALFNGGPIETGLPLWTTLLLLPFLLLLAPRFLATRPVLILLTILATLKLLLTLFTPTFGLNVFLYDTPPAMKENRWERTYNSLWQGEVSQRMRSPYPSARFFPLEWLNRNSDEPEAGLGWIGLKIAGKALLPKGERLVFLATGLERGAVNGTATGAQGIENTYTFPIVSDLADLREIRFPHATTAPAEQELRLQGEFVFGGKSGDDSTLQPLLVGPNGSLRDPFEAAVFAVDHPGGSSFLTFAGRLIDSSLIGFFLLWAMTAPKGGGIENSYTFARIGLGGFIMVGVLHTMGTLWPDGATLFHLSPTGRTTDAGAASWTLAGMMAPLLLGLAAYRTRTATQNDGWGRGTLLVVGPAVLLHCAFLWGDEPGAVRLLSPGHDWHTYQDFARHIFVYGDWLSLHEGIYRYMPFYRYIVGGLHTLFGQSMVTGDVWDLWMVLLSGGALASILRALPTPLPAPLLGAALYYLVALNGGFFWLLDKGLQEISSLGFMMAALWLLVTRSPLDNRTALMAGALAALAMATRVDHIGPLAAMVLFGLPPAAGRGALAMWRNLIAAAWKRIIPLALYWGTLGLAPLLIGTRNYLVGGIFCLDDPRDLSAIECHHSALSCAVSNVAVVFAAADPGSFSFGGVVIMAGSLLALLGLVWRGGALQALSPPYGLSVAAVFAPYLLYTPFGYAPRFSTHLLPFVVMTLVMVATALLVKQDETPRTNG